MTEVRGGPTGGVVGVVLVSPLFRATHATIAAAIAAAVSGDIILLGPGSYSESFTIPAGVSLVGSSGVTIAGAAGTAGQG